MTHLASLQNLYDNCTLDSVISGRYQVSTFCLWYLFFTTFEVKLLKIDKLCPDNALEHFCLYKVAIILIQLNNNIKIKNIIYYKNRDIQNQKSAQGGKHISNFAWNFFFICHGLSKFNLIFLSTDFKYPRDFFFLKPVYFILRYIPAVNLVIYENPTLRTIGVSNEAKSQLQETFTYAGNSNCLSQSGNVPSFSISHRVHFSTDAVLKWTRWLDLSIRSFSWSRAEVCLLETRLLQSHPCSWLKRHISLHLWLPSIPPIPRRTRCFKSKYSFWLFYLFPPARCGLSKRIIYNGPWRYRDDVEMM